MNRIRLLSGGFMFEGRFEQDQAPKTCAAFRPHLPFKSRIVHVRWSGEAVWAPLGALDFGIGYENSTCYPAPGQVLLYPGGVSETEILIAYGAVNFASKAGQLAGNQFISLTSSLDDIASLGRKTLWEGAQDLLIEAA